MRERFNNVPTWKIIATNGNAVVFPAGLDLLNIHVPPQQCNDMFKELGDFQDGFGHLKYHHFCQLVLDRSQNKDKFSTQYRGVKEMSS